ncbi:pyridoxal-phosphate dependent enzyme [Pseudonocardia acaciae]|uniref:pyridoxal-phosphate dependent enzyme n=1 Tax=Pseudonocardia acaciae TaxID=551276 RepID=UPI003CCB7BAA
MPGYRPTALVESPALASELGIGRLFVKDESSRLGLPAFKALGASWAIHQAISARVLGPGATGPGSLEGLRELASRAGELRLVTATDGNHGRAVARFARLLGLPSEVYLPEVIARTHPASVEAIRAEGARVVIVAEDYDATVATAARAAAGSPEAELVQDTGWPGYETIPATIVAGYSTLFREIDDQLRAAGVTTADAVVVPVGVGSLAQAAVTHYRGGEAPEGTVLVSVEPDVAACALASLRNGTLTTIPTAATTMAGLNCGTPSSLAWPHLRDGLDCAVAVSDDQADTASRDLRAQGVDSGPCGAASLAGLRAVLDGFGNDLGLGAESHVVLLSTEGR